MNDQAKQKASAEDIRVAIETALRRRDPTANVRHAPTYRGTQVTATAWLRECIATASGNSGAEEALCNLAAACGLRVVDDGTVSDPAVELVDVIAERDALSAEVRALRARVAELEASVGPAQKPPIIPAKFAKRLAPYVEIHAEENTDGTVSLARTALGERKFDASVPAANVRATVISLLLSVLRDARRSGHEDAEATIDAINRVDVLFDALWPEVQP